MAWWDTARLKEQAADAMASVHEAAVRRPAVAAAVGAGALLAVVGLVWVLASGPRPSPVEDPAALAEFIGGAKFEKLPAEQKRPYMKLARKQLAQIEALRRDDKIDHHSYRSAYLAARMERQLDEMHDYFKRPAAQRAAWIDTELRSKEQAHPATRPAATTRPAAAGKPASPPGGAASASEEGRNSLLYHDEKGREKFDKMKDDFEQEFLDTWTPEGRRQWEEFHTAYKQHREARQRELAGAPPAAHK